MYTIGIDLGGTNIVAGLVDENYKIIDTAAVKTAMPRSAESIMDDMAMLCRKVVEQQGLTLDDVAYVGVGCPGTCNVETGEVEYANNLKFSHVMLGPELNARLNKPIYIDNDANAAALGEAKAGATKNAAKSICITLGTGVGSGIVLDGKIYGGSNYAGGELGHTVIVAGGEQCTCGRRGCWETYSSATALMSQTRAAMEQNPDSLMWKLVDGDINKVDGRIPFEAAKQGDAAGQAVVDKYVEYLACGLVNVINIFQPDIICVGGGVCRQGENLLGPVRKIIEDERYSKYSEKQTQLCVAELGNDAGIVGAACLGENA